VLYWIYQWMASMGRVQAEERVLFRAALAIGCGFLIVILTGNRAIRWLLKQKSATALNSTTPPSTNSPSTRATRPRWAAS